VDDLFTEPGARLPTTVASPPRLLIGPLVFFAGSQLRDI
jgi:hypothetical protein